MFLIGLGLFLVVVIGLAAWSDRRDRRNDIDPRMRVRALTERRRLVRRQRIDRMTKRLNGSSRRKDRPEDRPWER